MLKDKSSIFFVVVGFIFLMIACAYLAVPLYKLFCQTTGFGGTVHTALTAIDAVALDANRFITVTFNSDVAGSMPWRFVPAQREITVKVGEAALIFYQAENFSDTAITGVATYNVSPQKAAVYFNKIQCFCFEEQRLNAHEVVDMPVFFLIDPAFLQDSRMSDVNTITLSYTFFDVKDEF